MFSSLCNWEGSQRLSTWLISIMGSFCFSVLTAAFLEPVTLLVRDDCLLLTIEKYINTEKSKTKAPMPVDIFDMGSRLPTHSRE